MLYEEKREQKIAFEAMIKSACTTAMMVMSVGGIVYMLASYHTALQAGVGRNCWAIPSQYVESSSKKDMINACEEESRSDVTLLPVKDVGRMYKPLRSGEPIVIGLYNLINRRNQELLLQEQFVSISGEEEAVDAIEKIEIVINGTVQGKVLDAGKVKYCKSRTEDIHIRKWYVKYTNESKNTSRLQMKGLSYEFMARVYMKPTYQKSTKGSILSVVRASDISICKRVGSTMERATIDCEVYGRHQKAEEMSL